MDRKWDYILTGVVCSIVLLGVGVFVYGKTSTYDSRMSVTATDWQRTIDVQKYQELYQSDEDSYPADAYNVSSHDHTDVEYVPCGKTLCPIYTHETLYDYNINRWLDSYHLVSGAPSNVPMFWRDFTPSADQSALGALREGWRRETLNVRFVTPDKTDYTYVAPNLATWQSYMAGQSYTVSLNRFNEALWDTLKRIDAR